MKKEYIAIIQEIANDVRKKNGFDDNNVIGDYIFTILQQECVVMMKPLRNQPDLDGFSTEKIIQRRLQTVVFINTEKNVEKQNFCAAHELGHRYQVNRLICDQFPDEVILPSDVEKIMNRFAAELMMPEKDFKERSGKIWYASGARVGSHFQITVKKAIQAIIELMDFYYMPYKAVLYRMAEVGHISEKNRDYLEKYECGNKNVVDQMILEMGITRLRTPDRKMQNSIPLGSDKAVFAKAVIAKYLTEKEAKQYLKNMGLSKESITLASKLRKIETEMLELSGKP